MFSYLILCPSTGPSLIRPARPVSPLSPAPLPVQCSWTPGAAGSPASTPASCSSSLHAPAPTCPGALSSASFKFFLSFFFFFFSPLPCSGRSREELSGGFLCTVTHPGRTCLDPAADGCHADPSREP
uniref:Uncharacterized protein n=1 Tax=Canis lupus familiaris TaxID=9615 RepID=A0A8C0SEE6_CANLF